MSETMPGPGPEHERLKPFVGTFRAEVKIWMGPGDPVVSSGTMENRLVLGGRFLSQSYKGDPGAAPFPDFEGRGLWGFNSVNGRWEGVWVDNASTMMQYETGELDETGKVWTMIGELPDPSNPGRTMTKRSLLTLEDEDHHSMEMFFRQGDRENRAMAIRYERAG